MVDREIVLVKKNRTRHKKQNKLQVQWTSEEVGCGQAEARQPFVVIVKDY